MDEKKATELMRDSDRPKNKKDWGTGGCPFFVFGDEDAAEYDMKAMKKFFSKFKKKKRD